MVGADRDGCGGAEEAGAELYLFQNRRKKGVILEGNVTKGRWRGGAW